jgi:hypothetical protein
MMRNWRRRAVKTIPEVKLPDTDPALVKDGALLRLWKRSQPSADQTRKSNHE